MTLHPEEEQTSRPVGQFCRWRDAALRGIVVGQVVERHAASVFLRGRHGMTLKAAYAALAPFADSLEHRLGVPLRGGRPALLGVKRLDIDVVEPSNWPEVSRWLRLHARDYDDAIREVCLAR